LKEVVAILSKGRILMLQSIMQRTIWIGLLAPIFLLSSVSAQAQEATAAKPAEAVSAQVEPEKPKPPFDVAAPAAPPERINGTDLKNMASGDLFVLSRTALGEKHYQIAAIAQYWYVQKEKEERYELACYSALAGQTDAAFYWLQRAAIEDGIDIRDVERDVELESLRADPRWPKLLDYVRACEKYFGLADLSRTVIVFPKEYHKPIPITTIVWLHGYGSRPDDFVNKRLQPISDSMNIAFVGISATISRGPKRFEWAVDIEKDLKRIREGLALARKYITIDKGRMVALGFSQGAQVGLEVAVRHPDEFAGAIVLSAGSRSQLAAVKPSELLAKRGFVVCCNAEERPGTVKLTEADAEWLRTAKAKLIHKAYPNVKAHTFPEDFDERFPEWIRFVLEAGDE